MYAPARFPLTRLALAVLLAGPASPLNAQRPLEVWSAVSARELVAEVAAERGFEVVLRTDATSRIVRQIGAGAPAEVLVTADGAWMGEAVSRGLVESGAPRPIALNRLVLFERAGDGPSAAGAPPRRAEAGDLPEVTGASLLARATSTPGPLLAVAGPEVPVGRYARQAFAALGVDGELGRRTVSVSNARAVLVTVLAGEVPLGVGYLSDVLREPGLRLVGAFGVETHAPVEVWAAPIAGARPEASALVAALADPATASLRTALGFATPQAAAVQPPAREGSAAPGPPLGPVLRRTVAVGVLAVLLATLPAVLLGRWMARSRSPWRGPVGTALLLPLVLPPVVTGFVLLALFGSAGPLGPLLAAAGIRLSFTLAAAVVAAAVVGFPLYAVVVRNAFEAVDPRYEELAWTLGSPPGSTFRRVALPLALPGVAAGAVLALARGLGEFGATVVVAGNIEGETQTLALAVYQLLESPDGRARIWAFVAASVVIAALGLAAWEWLGARHRARLLDGGRR